MRWSLNSIAGHSYASTRQGERLVEVMPDLSNDQIIRALYASILGREPDDEGLDHYGARLRDGATLEELILDFIGSAEFRRRHLGSDPYGGKVIDYAALGLEDAGRSGWYLERNRALCPGFPIAATDTLADIGCGDGGHSIFCARFASKVIAVDVDSEKLATTERRLKAEGMNNYVALLSDGNPLPIDGGTVDKIICTEVLEHVDDPDQFLGELVRIGKQGATYLIKVPDERSEQVLKRVAPASAYQKPNHIRIFSREEFEATVRRAGLQVLEHKYLSFYWAVWTTLAWKCGGLDGRHPVLDNWARVWAGLLDLPEGQDCKEALDFAMPKDQMIIARKIS
jgi:2-polyprenyl-3-methyl-5-hydroxy-6-metoxy-1,4-benzoquinol methylase